MSLKSFITPTEFVILQNAPLSDRLKAQLESLNISPLVTAPNLEEALKRRSAEQIFILSENRICLYQRQLNFMESFPPESLSFILDRQNDGGCHSC